MTEAEEQKDVVSWFRGKWPEHAKSLRCSARGQNQGSRKRAYMMKKHIDGQGGVQGEADLAILLPKGGYGCLLIEHKAADGDHKLSQEQIDYLEYHNGIGNLAVSTRGTEAMKAAITCYMEQ